MDIVTPELILNATNRIFKKEQVICYKNGIPIEKGVIITKERLDKKIRLYEQYVELFMQYPDLYLELIKPAGSKFHLRFYQIIFIRACMRFGRVLTIAPRAAGKSFICILALYLICIFRPGSHVR